MSWKIIEKYRRLLAEEEGGSPRGWGGKLTVCLVYPNRYYTAMSNLGFQAVHAQLNAHPDVVCERAFLPDPDDLAEYEKSRASLLSLDSQRPLTDFHVIAFSVSFESDYLNMPAIFRLAGIPPLTEERGDSYPLVIAGGAALFLNPEPVADFLDLVCIGEAEPLLPTLLDLLRSGEGEGREELLARAARLPGIYVPSLYELEYDGLRIAARRPLAGAPERVERQWLGDLDRHATTSELLTPRTEFADMYLIELSRGCPRGCRFCAAGFIYLPYRQRSLEEIKEQVLRGLQERKKLGLVGAAVSDFKGIGELCRFILQEGGKVSVSSLRLDQLDDDMIAVLKASGHKTVALAPEGGSQRLRDLVKKDITEEQILAACDLLIGSDILNLKLYFIIGLPTETTADLEELVALVEKIRVRVIAAAKANRRLGEVVLSVNPFVPKPFTPFQWCGMEDMKSLERKAKFLHQAFNRLSNVRLQLESPREAYLQALLSRGDRRLAALLLKADETGSWKRAAKALQLDTDDWVYGSISLDETLPWDFVAGGSRERLEREYLLAFADQA